MDTLHPQSLVASITKEGSVLSQSLFHPALDMTTSKMEAPGDSEGRKKEELKAPCKITGGIMAIVLSSEVVREDGGISKPPPKTQPEM